VGATAVFGGVVIALRAPSNLTDCADVCRRARIALCQRPDPWLRSTGQPRPRVQESLSSQRLSSGGMLRDREDLCSWLL